MAMMKFREPNQVKYVGTRPGHNGTQVAESASADNGIVVVYTVPAAVTFFFTHYISHGINAAGVGEFYIRNVVDALWVQLVAMRQHTAVGNANYISGNFWPPLEVPTGYDICVRSFTAGFSQQAFIHGWVE